MPASAREKTAPDEKKTDEKPAEAKKPEAKPAEEKKTEAKPTAEAEGLLKIEEVPESEFHAPRRRRTGLYTQIAQALLKVKPGKVLRIEVERRAQASGVWKYFTDLGFQVSTRKLKERRFAVLIKSTPEGLKRLKEKLEK